MTLRVLYAITNIEEIAVYEGDKIRQSIAKLIRTYNERINNIESDKSLMIEEPKWIRRYNAISQGTDINPLV